MANGATTMSTAFYYTDTANVNSGTQTTPLYVLTKLLLCVFDAISLQPMLYRLNSNGYFHFNRKDNHIDQNMENSSHYAE